MSKSDFDKIKIYKRAELQKENKKVIIKATTKMLENSMFYCENLDSVFKTTGQTFQIQKKFKIEDYK